MDSIKKYSSLLKEQIIQELEKIESPEIGIWNKDTIERIKNFSTNGKLVRGALICMIEEKVKKTISKDSLKAGAGLELFQSGLLIHDDIIDKDQMRRGEYSIHYQYTNMFKDNSKDPNRTGESLGICLGDICFFLGFKILSSIKNKKKSLSIIDLISKEMVYVGMAQMQDIYFSDVKNTDPTYEDIYKLYVYKTARYSFSLPLMIGGIISEINKNEIKKLSKIGEDIGVLFQIKDDQIDIFSSTEEIGKPVGSDIYNEKKTVYYYYINNYLKRKNKKISDYSLEEIKGIISNKGIDKKIEKIVKDISSRIYRKIEKIKNEEMRKIIIELTKYTVERKK